MGKLLFLATVFQQNRAQHADTKTEQGWPASEALHFFLKNLQVLMVKTAAAIGRGPARHGPAACNSAL